jgi:hypothetical protein
MTTVPLFAGTRVYCVRLCVCFQSVYDPALLSTCPSSTDPLAVQAMCSPSPCHCPWRPKTAAAAAGAVSTQTGWHPLRHNPRSPTFLLLLVPSRPYINCTINYQCSLPMATHQTPYPREYPWQKLSHSFLKNLNMARAACEAGWTTVTCGLPPLQSTGTSQLILMLISLRLYIYSCFTSQAVATPNIYYQHGHDSCSNMYQTSRLPIEPTTVGQPHPQGANAGSNDRLH